MIKKLYHISDIHIRLYQRHKEYREVFDELYTYLSNEKDIKTNGLIVVTGDLYHSKNDLSPEAVELTKELLNNLSNITTTVVIAGNHDSNLKNSHRLDSITPVIDKNNEKLHYLTESKIYDFDTNIRFSVCACKDLKIITDVSKDRINIFLYHGILDKINLNNKTLENNTIKLSDISMFDYALLGDIHKQMYLQKDKKPITAYAGSLVQQNFGELINGHGVLVWNLEDNTQKFIEIKNNYCYANISLENNKVITDVSNLSKNIRLRLSYYNCTNKFVEKYIANLKKSGHNIIEQHLFNNSVSKEKENISLNIINGLTDVANQNKLIEEFLVTTKKYTISLQMLQNILNYNIQNNKDIVYNLICNRNIKLLTLSFDNLFTYGKDNFINFTNINGLTGIIGPNRVGKSSIIDIILYALYDKFSRGYKSTHIINSSSDYFKLELVFSVNNKVYKIIKQSNYISGVNKKTKLSFEYAPVKSYFYEIDNNNNIINLTGKDRNETNKIIRDVVGMYEDIVYTSLMLQNSNSNFIHFSNSERKYYLSNILNIEIIKQLNNNCKIRLSEVSNKIKTINLIDLEKIQQLTMQLDKLNDNIIQNNETINLLELLNNDISDKINQLYNNKQKLDFLLSEDEYKICKMNIIKNDKEIDNIQRLINSINLYLIDLTLLLCEKRIVNALENNTNLLHKSILCKNDIQHLILNAKKTLKELDSKKQFTFDNNCQHCNNNKKILNVKPEIYDEYNQILELLQERLIKILEKSNLFQEDNNSLKTELVKINKLKEKITKNSELLKLKLNFLKKILLLSKINSLIELIIKTYDNNLNSIKNNDLIDEKIKEYKTKLLNNKRQLKQLAEDNTEFRSTIRLIEHKINENNLNLKQYIILKDLLDILELYHNVTSKDELQYYIVKSTLPILLNITNLILSLVCDFNIKIVDDNKNIDIVVQNDNNLSSRNWIIELCSGMLKFILNIAIRIALLKINNKTTINTFIIDEGFGNLTDLNLHNLDSLFEYLKNYYKSVLIITHINSIKGQIENFIEIKKDELTNMSLVVKE